MDEEQIHRDLGALAQRLDVLEHQVLRLVELINRALLELAR